MWAGTAIPDVIFYALQPGDLLGIGQLGPLGFQVEVEPFSGLTVGFTEQDNDYGPLCKELPTLHFKAHLYREAVRIRVINTKYPPDKPWNLFRTSIQVVVTPGYGALEVGHDPGC